MTTVLVPWRPGDPHREAAWEWVSGRYTEQHPDWRLIRCTCPVGPWVKALAVMPVIAECSHGPIVIADADVWCEGIDDAVRAVVEGTPWAMPHGAVRRLTRQATEAVLAGAELSEKLPLEEPVRRGVGGGGIVVAMRDTLLSVPMDSRFVGWGQEDTALALALTSLAGSRWRGKQPLWHLWHPPQERLTRRWGSGQSKRLYHRYAAARRDPKAMRALIEEAYESRNTLEPSLHAASALRGGD